MTDIVDPRKEYLRSGSEFRPARFVGSNWGSMSRRDGVEVPDQVPPNREKEVFTPIRHVGDGFNSMHRRDGQVVDVRPPAKPKTPCPTDHKNHD